MLAKEMQCMHNASMTSITIRNVPDPARNELAARARRSGRSLQEYLRALLIDVAEQPDVSDHLASIRSHKRLRAESLDEATILELRETDRR